MLTYIFRNADIYCHATTKVIKKLRICKFFIYANQTFKNLYSWHSDNPNLSFARSNLPPAFISASNFQRHLREPRLSTAAPKINRSRGGRGPRIEARSSRVRPRETLHNLGGASARDRRIRSITDANGRGNRLPRGIASRVGFDLTDTSAVPGGDDDVCAEAKLARSFWPVSQGF